MSDLKKCCCASGRFAGIWLNQACAGGEVVLCFRCYQALLSQFVIEESFEAVGDDFHNPPRRARSIALQIAKGGDVDETMQWFCRVLDRLQLDYGVKTDEVSHALISTRAMSTLIKANYSRVSFRTIAAYEEWNRREKRIAEVPLIAAPSIPHGHAIFVLR